MLFNEAFKKYRQYLYIDNWKDSPSCISATDKRDLLLLPRKELAAHRRLAISMGMNHLSGGFGERIGCSTSSADICLCCIKIFAGFFLKRFGDRE